MNECARRLFILARLIYLLLRPLARQPCVPFYLKRISRPPELVSTYRV